MISLAMTLLVASGVAFDQRLDQALGLLGKGDPSAAGHLIAIGLPAAHSIAGYVRDPKVEVRRAAVLALEGIGGAESCSLLAAPLADLSLEIRGRAALAIYRRCPRANLPCPQLIEGLHMPDPSAAAILLGGYCHEAKGILQKPLTGNLKLEAYGPLVRGGLVASVSLLRLGDQSQTGILANAVKSQSLAETEFILQVLPDIANPRLVMPMFDDLRETSFASKSPAGAKQPRRICDIAADLLADRVEVKLPFDRKPFGRYTAQQLQLAKAAIAKKLP